MEGSLRETVRVISGLRRGVNEVLAILGCYATLIAGYRRFGTAYWSQYSGFKQSKCSCYRCFGTDSL